MERGAGWLANNWVVRRSVVGHSDRHEGGYAQVMLERRGWRAHVELHERDGAILVVRVRFGPVRVTSTPEGGLSGHLLRTLPLDEVISYAAWRFKEHSLADLTATDAWLTGEREPSKTGPPSDDANDILLAHLAVRYERLVGEGCQAIHKTLAPMLSVHLSSIGDKIRQARAKRYLAAATPGKRGGKASKKAKELVARYPNPPFLKAGTTRFGEHRRANV